MKKKSMIFLIVGLVSLIVWSGVRIVADISFYRQVEGHLELAAKANTIELAKVEMQMALANIKHKQLTQGYTSVLYQTPNEDVEFWYTNMKESLIELDRIKPDATQLEKSNLLMKLHETLIHKGEKSESIYVPSGITIFPHNILFAIWGWLTLICFLPICVRGVKGFIRGVL